MHNILHRYNLKDTLKSILILSIGLTVAAFGIAMTYKSGIGNSPMATITDGLSRQLNVSYGVANVIINIVFLLIAIRFLKEKVFIGSFIVAFSMGMYINLYVALLANVTFPDSWAIPLNLIGLLITVIGISTVVVIDYGLGPLELMTELIHKKLNRSYRLARVLFDSSLLVLGILMGGVYGLGTIFNVLLVGSTMQLFFRIFGRKVSQV
jgi:uncharacterized membrane protein YczE